MTYPLDQKTTAAARVRLETCGWLFAEEKAKQRLSRARDWITEMELGEAACGGERARKVRRDLASLIGRFRMLRDCVEELERAQGAQRKRCCRDLDDQWDNFCDAFSELRSAN